MDLISKALKATRESKNIEFKQKLDIESPGDWCEVIKDIVAMANSGGGVIVFGLDDNGVPFNHDQTELLRSDPADIGNKIAKYIGGNHLDFEIRECRKEDHRLLAFLVLEVDIPFVFEKPGTYSIGEGKQKTAFSAGTVYFRHGAKSEPGSQDDIRYAINRQLEKTRKSWMKGIKKVVLAKTETLKKKPASYSLSSNLEQRKSIRVVSDPLATPVRLTRDPILASEKIVYEQVSDAIFDEINNVIDANRSLAKGQKRFCFGPHIYYRIYAERHHVVQRDSDISLLLRSGIFDFYAPVFYWHLHIPIQELVDVFTEIYVNPKGLRVHYLMKEAVLLGGNFALWLQKQMTKKWEHHAQPPNFYFTFAHMSQNISSEGLLLSALRKPLSSQIQIADKGKWTIKQLIGDPILAENLLSETCMRVYNGENDFRQTARTLDILSYGNQISEKLNALGSLIIQNIGERELGEFSEDKENE